jgi:hypothetical protein
MSVKLQSTHIVHSKVPMPGSSSEIRTWNFNDEYLLTEIVEVNNSTISENSIFLTISDIRKREWMDRVQSEIVGTAKKLAAFLRCEGTIDSRSVVIAAEGRHRVLRELQQFRCSSIDYSNLTIQSACLSLLKKIESIRDCNWSDLANDVVLEQENFPLGYRLRDALSDLERQELIEVKKTKRKPPLISLTHKGRRLFVDECS